MEPLFRAETVNDYETYKEFAKTMRNKIAKFPLIISIEAVIMAGITLFFMSIEPPENYTIFTFIPLIMGLVLVVYLFITNHTVPKRAWNEDKVSKNKKYTIDFFSDRLEQHSENGKFNVRYEDVLLLIETDTAFYIMTTRNSGIPLPKYACPEGLDELLRSSIRKVKRV